MSQATLDLDAPPNPTPLPDLPLRSEEPCLKCGRPTRRKVFCSASCKAAWSAKMQGWASRYNAACDAMDAGRKRKGGIFR